MTFFSEIGQKCWNGVQLKFILNQHFKCLLHKDM